MQSDLYADDHHWGDEPVDVSAHDLPALKARYLLDALPPSGRLLEIGCGGGRLLNTIARARPDLELHGCDIRPLQNDPSRFTFSLVEPEATALPYDAASFDAIVAYDVLEHLLDPTAVIAQARALVAPGAPLISFTPLEGQPFSLYRWYRRLLGDDLYVRTKEHVQAFSEADLRAIVEPTFVITECEYAYHLLGHMMDATMFAALEIPALRRRFWTANPFYAESGSSGADDSALARALRLANAIAYHESRLLRHRSFAAAGILFTARAR